MGYFADRAKDEPSAIQAPATTLTLGSGAAAFIAAAVVLFNDSFHEIFGDDASTTIKASVLIAIIAAWTLVTVADLFSRAIAKAATERATAEKEAAKESRAATSSLVALPAAMRVKKTGEQPRKGLLAVAAQVDGEGKTSILVAKAGIPPEWVDLENVTPK